MTDIKDEEEVKGPVISEKLIDALIGFYSPAENIADSDATKSTQELISEMSDMDDIFPYEVNRLMEEHGFKIHYNGSCYVWLLKEK